MAKKKVTGAESSKNELSAQINTELDKAIDDLTLFDDDLMSNISSKHDGFKAFKEEPRLQGTKRHLNASMP